MLAIYTLAARLLINLNFPKGKKRLSYILLQHPYGVLRCPCDRLPRQAIKSNLARPHQAKRTNSAQRLRLKPEG